MVGRFAVKIVGFYREETWDALSENSGVYFVFRGERTGDRRCRLHELIYIGKAEEQGIKHRVQNHEKLPVFRGAVQSGELLYFAYAEIDSATVGEVEAALINRFDPVINRSCTESFTSVYEEIHISISGSVPILFSENIEFSVRPERRED